ncbi:efflux RND transporter periplasmic adaptor subunit [Leptospira paudalimensis]|uniref:Efflux RND transporter periplasmic adaptor subunit n=1 Tax=Leptospira paudalimensis TaxID=2950024 RepID=A0ABT3M9B0_9LEPT|nr:efflux RND transporter periplasmic adaptor subunit [Leptospira paudalimensis]MCW7504784.1 efflux RND transporter periplasmic adaptor subunit [Leptospira paudalimensis]
MKAKILQIIKSKLKYIILYFLVSITLSILFTWFSNENIRDRFPWLTTILYHKDWFQADQNVYAIGYLKDVPLFQKPHVIQKRITLEFPATVEATKEIQLQTKHLGRIKFLHVAEGQSVKKGELLLQLDDELLRLEGEKLSISLEVAKAHQIIALEKWKQAENLIEVKIREIDKKTELVEVARAEWETAKVTKEKKETMWKEGFVSLSELDRWKLDVDTKLAYYKNLIRDRESLLTTLRLDFPEDTDSISDKIKIWKRQNSLIEKTEYDLSVTNTKILENQIQTNQQMISEFKLYAPKSGSIFKVHLKEGELTNHLPAITLIENGDLSVSYQIGESDLRLMKLGKEVTFHPSLEGSQFVIGKIDKISSYLDVRSHGIGVRAKLQKNLISLLPGMFGLVHVETEGMRDSIVVPTNSMLGDESSGYYLMVKSGESVEKRYVECKPLNQSEMEIITGITEEDFFQINVR